MHRALALPCLLALCCATTPSSSAPGTPSDTAVGWVKTEGAVQVGAHPDFQLPRAGKTGGLRTLSQLRGQVVIVDFWASWCAPCKEAMPFYASLQAKYADDLKVLGVNVDEDPEAFAEAMRNAPPAFEVLRDAAGKVVAAFGVETMPTTFILDREGAVVMVHRGFVPSDRADLQRTIENLIAR